MNIRLVAGNTPFSGPDPRECDLSWERLDQVLYKLGGRAQGQGETLTFQLASGVAFTKQALAGLLPRFSETGICEGVAL